jgi:hypothetical protein
MSAASVDLVINCYERTYRHVLAPGTVANISSDNRYPFARRTVLVNNVLDGEDVAGRAQALVDAGEIDAAFYVEDHLATGLAAAGLRPAELGKVPYFTDWALAALVLPGPDWMLHWDAEASLAEPVDWITPSIELMEDDPRVLVANPSWGDDEDLLRHTSEQAGPFALGHGFSDQVFLVRRRELARPIYHDRTLADLRYPVAHLGRIFEARIDSHIRRRGRLRATYRPAVWRHNSQMGVAYPPRTLTETLLYARNRAVTVALTRLPRRLRPSTLRLL